MNTLLASAARTVSGNSGLLTGVRWGLIEAAIFEFALSAAATDANDTLDVFLQSSHDGGTTWDDFVHFTQAIGTGGAQKFLAKWIRDIAPEREHGAAQDGVLAASSVLQGLIGPDVRVKWVIVDPTGANASFTFSVSMTPIYKR